MLEILKNKDEIRTARNCLKYRCIDELTKPIQRLLDYLCRRQNIIVGDVVKSWDILKTIDFIDQNVAITAPILDIGAFASEVLLILRKLGYCNLTGIDLNPMIENMSYNESIKYNVGNFLESSYENGSFGVITAISVIEHGFDSKRLLGEIARLLDIDGYFIASFDYWPEKIDSGELEPFGLSWTIFSKTELAAFIEDAQRYDLHPVGALDYAADQKAISWHGKEYTFGWLVLQKRGSDGKIV